LPADEILGSVCERRDGGNVLVEVITGIPDGSGPQQLTHAHPHTGISSRSRWLHTAATRAAGQRSLKVN